MKTMLPGCRSKRVLLSTQGYRGFRLELGLTDRRVRYYWHGCTQVLERSASKPPKQYLQVILHIDQIGLLTACSAQAAQARGRGGFHLCLRAQSGLIAVKHAFSLDGWMAHEISGQGFESRGHYPAFQLLGS